MFRWLFGWGAQEQANDAQKKEVKPVQRWVSDSNGGYVRVNASSTGKAIAGFNLATDAAKNASTLTDFPFPDTGNAENAVEVDDALSAYEGELARQAKELHTLLDRWKQKKVEVISGDYWLQAYDEALSLAHPGKTLLPTLGQFFTNLFQGIHADLESADDELHELLEQAHGQVQDVCDHLDKACVEIARDDLDETKRRQLSVDMCNMSIEILNELIALTQNIQSELAYCLKCEKITEGLALQLVQMAVLIVLKVPLAGLDLNFNDSYRHFLYNEIKGEKLKIEEFETDIRGQLAYAMKMVNEHSVSLSPKTTQVGKLSMFTKEDAQQTPVNTAPVQEQEQEPQLKQAISM